MHQWPTQPPSTRNNREVADRAREVVVDCLRHRASGEAISDESLLRAHPDLRPDLDNELRRLRVIDAARDGASAADVRDSAHTIEYTPTRKDSAGLHIRCPHCSNPVEVISDTPLR